MKTNNSNFYSKALNFSLEQLNEALLDSCISGDLDKVKFLLTSPKLKYHVDIHYQDNSPLHQACEHNQLEIVKYLLSSPELKKHANIHARSDWALTIACNEGHFQIVKYLLTSPDLKEHSSFNVGQLHYSIKFQHKDIVNYLLTSPDLKKHVDIHMHHDYIFKDACEFADMVTMQYLIYDLNIKKTKEINKYLERSTGRPGRLINEAKKMFELRDLKKDLNKDLVENGEVKKKFKIYPIFYNLVYASASILHFVLFNHSKNKLYFKKIFFTFSVCKKG